MVAGIDTLPRVIRPANFPRCAPGKGWVRVDTPEGPLVVMQLIGRVFMQPHYDCPFQAADRLLSPAMNWPKTVLVDFHGEASSERMAMGRYLDGRVAAVVGTHTHCQTSDEQIFPGGTAYITDLGMTGPSKSILGREIEPVVKKFTTGIPHRFDVAKEKPVLEGVILDVNLTAGTTRSIERIRLFL
jgi:metallophosphoesterase (TIGR00282 family)